MTYAATQPEKDDVAKFIKELDKTMPWDANKEETPLKTYVARLDEKDREKDVLKKANDQLKAQKDDFERQSTAAALQLAEEKKIFVDSLAKANKDIQDEVKKVRDQIDTLQKDLASKGKEKADETLAHADTRRKLDALEKLKRTLETKLASATKDMKDVRETLAETESQLKQIAEKTNVDLKAIEAEKLDARALDVLRAWTRNWQIVDMDRRGKMPYINLGSADGLTSQVTFSVHTLGLDGKLSPNPKGTLEVVRVIGPHLAQCG